MTATQINDDFDAQIESAHTAIAAIQGEYERAAVAGNSQRLDELESERHEIETQVERIGAARRGAAAKARQDAAINRTASAEHAAVAVNKLALDRTAAILKIGAAIRTLGLAAAEVDAIDVELRDKMADAINANVVDPELRQRLAASRTVGGDTVIPVLAALHAATRANIFYRCVDVHGFTTPAKDLGQAAARDSELLAGWLESLGRYQAIEKDARK